MVAMSTDLTLIEIDERGRTSLGRLHPEPGRYLGELQSDGTVVLHPATITTRSQSRLLSRPDVMQAIDELAADPAAGVRRGRPKRRNSAK